MIANGSAAPPSSGHHGVGMVLTGGIGSGKSTVGRLLSSWGAYVVDADALAREVVGKGSPGLAAVVEAFGKGVLDDDGALDRATMAALVFHDPSELARLEAIIHPLVHELAQERIAAAPTGAMIVYEVPVMGRLPDYASRAPVVVVDVPDDTRQARLAARGLNPEQISGRMRNQPSRQQWVDVADYVVDNRGDLAQLEEEVAGLWRQLTGQSWPASRGNGRT
jgi:dephospho-CoA kinase